MRYFYILSTFVIVFSIFGVIIPYKSYALQNVNNSFSIYSEKCNNDSCVVTKCDDTKPCNSPNYGKKSSNNDISGYSSNHGSNSKDTDLLNNLKQLLNSH